MLSSIHLAIKETLLIMTKTVHYCVSEKILKSVIIAHIEEYIILYIF